MNVILEKRNNTSPDAEKAMKIAGNLGINAKLVELLFSRGIESEKDIKDFLFPNAANFHDPFLMKGMEAATQRIEQAIENKEKIVIYGDYDADGICSNAILSLYFTSRGVDIYSHTPNRINEGYGLNIESLSKIIENVMPDLIITCDCGISGYDEVEFVKDLGVDIIVTDHHEVGSRVPQCIVINPKQSDCRYPFKGLCGAGVVLKLIQALSGVETMYQYIDLCSVATIADLVPLLDENRLIVQMGLKRIENTKNIGLKSLLASQNLVKPTAGDIAFKISPRINAAGRMGDAYRAYELLTSSNKTRILEIIKNIEVDNTRRKELSGEMYADALVDIKYEDIVHNRALVLCNAEWEKGVTGILAAKLSGDFMRPTFIMAKSGDCFKGTCRSIDGINIYDVLSKCADLLVEFGGHSQAAGFSIMPENINNFKQRVYDVLSEYDDNLFVPKVKYDMQLDDYDITYEFVDALELLEPTGNSNPKPAFCVEAGDLSVVPCKNNAAHVSINIGNNIQVFAFNYSKVSYQLMGHYPKQLVLELQKNNFGGKDVKGILRACCPSKLYINEKFAKAYNLSITSIKSDEGAHFTEYENIDAIYKDRLYGTLVIAGDADGYNRFVESHNMLINEYMYTTTVNNFSRIIVAPDLDDENISFANYDSIIFLFRPYDEGIISYLNKKTHAEIFIPEKIDTLPKVTAGREVFMQYYDKIKRHANEKFVNVTAFYKKLNKETDKCDFAQLVACLAVFEQLGILRIDRDPFVVTITHNKADLKQSPLYCHILKEEQNA